MYKQQPTTVQTKKAEFSEQIERTDLNIVGSGRAAHGVYKRCTDKTDDVDGWSIFVCLLGGLDRSKSFMKRTGAMRERSRGRAGGGFEVPYICTYYDE